MRLSLSVIALVLINQAHAEEASLQLGVGLSVINLPDYRGSDEQHSYLLPVPYISYRSDKLEVSRAGIRGKLFDSERAEIDVSVNLTPPSHSDGNIARAGMPKLSPTVEIGPSIKYRLTEADAKVRWEAVLPLRAALVVDDWRTRYFGTVINPKLAAEWQFGQGDAIWRMGWSGGALIGSRKQHEYFYGVGPEFATTNRPAYKPSAGYAGLQSTLSASRDLGDYWLGLFLRLDNLNGSRFADSPLVKQKTNLSGGIALVWRFYRKGRP
ncbi:MipA/OmpV family protein [Chitinimonas sp. PSY-7]|uniref:MipA/OmpV family protein n=1 Tax=Chitinimonas sp. PSY-7 TaxID=3459088 RepID=UPI00403FF0B5